jgi:hypothetical protein
MSEINEKLMYKGHHIEGSNFYGKCLKDFSREEILELVVCLLKEKDEREGCLKHERSVLDGFR